MLLYDRSISGDEGLSCILFLCQRSERECGHALPSLLLLLSPILDVVIVRKRTQLLSHMLIVLVLCLNGKRRVHLQTSRWPESAECWQSKSAIRNPLILRRRRRRPNSQGFFGRPKMQLLPHLAGTLCCQISYPLTFPGLKRRTGGRAGGTMDIRVY